MQNNQITVGDKSYERFQEYPDRSVYTTDGHTVANPHVLTLGRIIPATTAAMVKTRAKHSHTVTRPGTTETGSIIIETNVSYPQWVEQALVVDEVNRHADFLDTPAFDSLVATQNI